jgi:hypothetical protein
MMKYLLDTNVLRHYTYTDGYQTLRQSCECTAHTLRAAIEGHGESGATEDEHRQD